MKRKIIALSMLSGGLDSILATKLVLDQGIKCIGINFKSLLFSTSSKEKNYPELNAKTLDIEYIPISDDKNFINIVRNPKYGHGQGINPCIDCKIFIFKKAKELMEKYNASFIVTGEVVGQRPMSQHMRALEIIEKEAGLEGKILRPLSANLLDDTMPVQEGWIDKTKLLSINGRSRKEQLALAKKYNINEYSPAAGGCLLTEKMFAIKLFDLFEYKNEIDEREIELLKIGRHFRIGENKIIVGRNQTENEMLLSLKNKGELLFQVPDIPGPTTLLQNKPNDDTILFAARLTALYSDSKDSELIVDYGDKSMDKKLSVEPLTKDEAFSYNVSSKKIAEKKNIG